LKAVFAFFNIKHKFLVLFFPTIRMQVYNSLTGMLEEFITITPYQVNMYVCGITTYDSPHLGHARSAIAFDLIRRYLQFKGFSVKYVQNFTDLDDKMINRANKESITIFQLAEKYIAEYEQMQKLLRIKIPDVRPRATQEIPIMIELIKKLESKGFTYVVDGSVYYDTSKFSDYKDIFRKKKNKDDIDSGNDEDTLYSQSDYAEDKHNIEDFVLWKQEKPGEPSWDSPWGKGRPGWHLECSAMAMKYLGETIDIHGGGKDLKSPHHHNEIAQSEAATDKPFSKYWLHNGFLNIDNTKMSKSLGNFVTIFDILKKYSGVVVRYFFLTSYYQRPVDFSIDKLDQAIQGLKRLQKTYSAIQTLSVDQTVSIDPSIEKTIDDNITQFFSAMDEDFNTAKAFGFLFALLNHLQKSYLAENRPISSELKKKLIKFFTDIDSFFNILADDAVPTQDNTENEWKIKADQVVTRLVVFRDQIRKEKNYALSDQIRDLLKASGVTIFDSKSSSTWAWDEK
jgi:cysteinyl-tRNA synthetase